MRYLFPKTKQKSLKRKTLPQDPRGRSHLLIAPDKFKGTLTAAEAARAMARGWRRARPKDQLSLLPISDGGDGFGNVLAELRGAKSLRSVAVNAAGRRAAVRWWWDAAGKTAIIESARVIGLAMLPKGKFHPFELDTRGLGMVLRAAAKRGARQCVLGIGGSATNDGGFGMARELGWRFLDRKGGAIERWTDLSRLSRIEAPRERMWPGRIIVAVDVQNRLLGPRGSTRVYGPQKGMRDQDFPKAEGALRQLARVVRREFGSDFAAQPGAGAAGGLGFGLAAFFGAKLTPGFKLIAREAKLNALLKQTNMVITGEGQLDRSTLMGKAAGELAACCRKLGLPCVALGGSVSDQQLLAKHFTRIGALTDLTSAASAIAKPKVWLARLAFAAAREVGQP